jgi:hypothetical protein
MTDSKCITHCCHNGTTLSYSESGSQTSISETPKAVVVMYHYMVVLRKSHIDKLGT